MQHWFGTAYEFRPEPLDKASGHPLQQVIVETAMRGEHLLGILPTGTGKSLCYQIPALSRFVRTGALSVVISPLVALMEDQVKGLRDRGIDRCAAINGLLSMPERAEVLERVRLGDVGILLIAPEQLRNRSVRKVLAQREIGAWISTRRIASRNGARIFAPITAMSPASSTKVAKLRPTRPCP